MTLHRWTAGADAAGRLDRHVAAQLGLSRSRAAALLVAGNILVDGRVPKKSEPVVPGQQVEARVPAPAPARAAPQDIPVEIVFQDGELAVVNKQPGIVVHPAPGHPDGTLVNALLHHVGDLSGVGGELRPGIVHRLDRDTSGLMVVAKTDRAHQALSQALKARRVKRVYLAALWGSLGDARVEVDRPIGRHPRDRVRMAVVPGGRPALTRFRHLESWPAGPGSAASAGPDAAALAGPRAAAPAAPGAVPAAPGATAPPSVASLCEAELGSGRTHQIRVHAAAIGHAVVGDAVYGAGRERGFAGLQRRWAAALARRTPRQFLHAHRLAFDHPVTGAAMTFEAQLPPDLAEVREWAVTGGVG